MFTKTLLASSLLVLNLLITTLACPQLVSRDTNSSTPEFPSIIPGSDEPSDWATTGYYMSHTSLNVRNITASIDFYTRVLGFRIMFNFRATSKVSIVYLAHSSGGKNGTAYQTAAELNRNKNNMQGLLELVHYDSPQTASIKSSTEVTNTFSHIGIIVPDIEKAQERFDTLGVKVFKRLGEEADLRGPIANAYGLGGVFEEDEDEAEEILAALSLAGSKAYIFAADPDGNYLEIQGLEAPGGFSSG